MRVFVAGRGTLHGWATYAVRLGARGRGSGCGWGGGGGKGDVAAHSPLALRDDRNDARDRASEDRERDARERAPSRRLESANGKQCTVMGLGCVDFGGGAILMFTT